MALNLEVLGRRSADGAGVRLHKLALYARSVGAQVGGELDYMCEKSMRIMHAHWAAIPGFEPFTDAYEYGQGGRA